MLIKCSEMQIIFRVIHVFCQRQLHWSIHTKGDELMGFANFFGEIFWCNGIAYLPTCSMKCFTK